METTVAVFPTRPAVIWRNFAAGANGNHAFRIKADHMRSINVNGGLVLIR